MAGNLIDVRPCFLVLRFISSPATFWLHVRHNNAPTVSGGTALFPALGYEPQKYTTLQQ